MAETNQNTTAENNNMETADFDALAKNALAQNEELIYSQVNSLINTYFIKEDRHDGTYYYKPVTIEVEMEQQVIDPGDPNTLPPVAPIFNTKRTSFRVPQITLAALSFLAVKSSTIDNDGKMEMVLGEVDVPPGVAILIKALTDNISPVSETFLH